MITLFEKYNFRKKLSNASKRLTLNNGKGKGSGLSAFRHSVAGIKFFHLHCEPEDTNLVGEVSAYFIPFRTAAVYPFSFPFGRKANLRSALELSFRPILGEQADHLTMLPVVTEQRPNLTRGYAWFVSKDEISEFEKLLGNKSIFLPAPLAFAAEVGGSGLVVWEEDGSACAVWFEDYEPKMYVYRPPLSDNENTERDLRDDRAADTYNTDEEYDLPERQVYADEDDNSSLPFSDSLPQYTSSAEELAKWVRAYSQQTGNEIDSENVRIFRACDISRDRLQRAAEASFAACSSFARLDLSNRGASFAEKYESFFAVAFSAIRAASISGLLFLLLSIALLAQNVLTSQSFEDTPSYIYSTALGEQSAAPLSSIASKLSRLSGGGVQLTIQTTLSNIAAAWEQLPEGTNVTADSVRYGEERTEIEGHAGKTDDIQSLRDALAKNGFDVKLNDAQQIPGGGMRFTLNLTEGGRKK
ncbi:MAG: type II secretion system protein GspL [Synergistes sp.]|nr:type II secretion system protein GspL [Synergistes sp.]